MTLQNIASRTLLVILAGTTCLSSFTACKAQTKTASTTQQKLASLRELHDSGLLSDDDYKQKLAQLKGPAPSATPHTASKVSMVPSVVHTLEDRSWGIPWGTVKLPAGWGFNGSVVHGDNCMLYGDNPMWIAESPDKTLGITILPVLKSGWVSDPRVLSQMQQAGCPILHSTRASDYLTKVILPHLHKTFTVVGTAPEPMFEPMANQFRQMNAQSQPLQSQGFQSRNSVDTARVVITYQEGGLTRVELASAELSCTETRMSGMGVMPSAENVDCTSYQTVIIHAPDDGTPITSLATMDLSKSTTKPFFVVTQNPAWQKRFDEVSQQKMQQMQAQNNANSSSNAAMIKDNQDAQIKQQAIRMDAQNYSAKVHNNVYQNQQAANAQVNGAYAAHMGDYNVYTNNSTGQQYQMSNQYNNTYVNQQGNVGLQTNSANSPGVDWTQLTPKY
jgi:hypothetical protein